MSCSSSSSSSSSASPSRLLPSALTGLVTCASLIVLGFACGGETATDPASSSSGGPPDGGGSVGQDTGSQQDVTPEPACKAPKTTCGTRCVDLRSDPKACGDCATTCKSDEGCLGSKCAKLQAFAVRKIFLGDTDRLGVKNKDAWKEFGENLDGLVSTAVANGECKLVGGAPQTVRADGTNGIDNSWGKEFLKLMEPFTPTPSKNTNDVIETGGRTPMIGVGDTQATFVFAEAMKTATPKWDGTDVRELAEPWTDGAGAPNTVFLNATSVGGVFDSGNPTATTTGLFAMGLSGADMVFPIRKLRIRMTIDQSGTAINGVISGYVTTKDLEDAMAKTAGHFSTDLCSGSTIEAIKASIRQASDILSDGTQDPNKECDAISIGLGFEAQAVTFGAVGPKPDPTANPCQ